MNNHKRIPINTPVSWYRRGEFGDYKVYGKVVKDNSSMVVDVETNRGKKITIQRTQLEVRNDL